jgi:putative ABC transport system ATP-binding protein
MTLPVETVRVEALCKTYLEGPSQHAVLRGVSMSLGGGEFVAIRGRSGSGKTTLLNLIAGLDRPTSGDIWYGETCLTGLSEGQRTLFRRRNLGLVFQFFNLIPTLTVIENVQLPAALCGLSQADLSRAESLLARVGLLDRAASYPDRLSGGEQQRVAIARALVIDPKLVLADEPTGNLDRASGEVALHLLAEVAREMEKTLLLVTHSRRVTGLADRQLSLEDGRLEETPSEAES